MKVVLDANCFINAVNPSSDSYPYLRRVFSAAHSGAGISLAISRHSLAEVQQPDAASELAKTVEVLPHWPIGNPYLNK